MCPSYPAKQSKNTPKPGDEAVGQVLDQGSSINQIAADPGLWTIGPYKWLRQARSWQTEPAEHLVGLAPAADALGRGDNVVVIDGLLVGHGETAAFENRALTR